MSRCESCKYCTELGRNSDGVAVMRRCIRKNGHEYEDGVSENCPDHEFTSDPYATRSAKCVNCIYCKDLIKNSTGCPVKRICAFPGNESEDFVVFDCPVFVPTANEQTIDKKNVSFGAKQAPASQANTAPQPKKTDNDSKSTLKTVIIICVIFLTVVTALKIILSGSLFRDKNKPADTVNEIPTSFTTDPITLPEITTAEPSAVIVTMNEPAYVTADNGLRLRSEASVDSDELALMPYMAELTILAEDDDWIYVAYNDMKGWCYRKYTENGTVTAYSQDEITAALNAANSVVASYCNRTLSGGKSILEPAYVIPYFQEAEKIYKQFVTSPGSLFDETHEDLKCSTASYDGRYFRVTDDKFTSVEALCEYMFTYFSDDVVKRMLNNKVFCINGDMYVYYGTVGETHNKVVTEPTVKTSLGCYTVELTVKIYDDPIDVNLVSSQYTISYPCSLINGRWVFTHMEVMPE